MSGDAGVGDEWVYAAVGGEVCAADADGVDFKEDVAGGNFFWRVDVDYCGVVWFLDAEGLQD